MSLFFRKNSDSPRRFFNIKDRNGQEDEGALSPMAINYNTYIGYIDILVERDSFDYNFHNILSQQCKIGDTVRISPGYKLISNHPGPIKKLLIFTSKLGIVSAILLLRDLLPPESKSNIDKARLVWVNEKTNHFLFEEELKKIHETYKDKLDVFVDLEEDIFKNNFAQNKNIVNSIPDYSEDVLCVISGPDYFTEKMTNLVRRRGYQEDHIVCI